MVEKKDWAELIKKSLEEHFEKKTMEKELDELHKRTEE
jgi:hypothetical protein